MSQAIPLLLDDVNAARLREIAKRNGITPEQFVENAVLRELKQTRDPAFEKAMQEVLTENHELFQRLAR